MLQNAFIIIMEQTCPGNGVYFTEAAGKNDMRQILRTARKEYPDQVPIRFLLASWFEK
jgi:hypothetical protein